MTYPPFYCSYDMYSNVQKNLQRRFPEKPLSLNFLYGSHPKKTPYRKDKKKPRRFQKNFSVQNLVQIG